MLELSRKDAKLQIQEKDAIFGKYFVFYGHPETVVFLVKTAITLFSSAGVFHFT